MKKQILIGMGVYLYLGFASQAQAYERIFYEDFENTTYTEHPFENNYGSSSSKYWEEFKAEVSQSNSVPKNGSYSLTYDPITSRNPHATMGLGDVTYGNLSNFSTSAVNHKKWYFRWYQRWEENIEWDGTHVKSIHVNQNSNHQGTSLVLQRGGTNAWQLTLRNNGNIMVNKYFSPAGSTMDDMQWHLLELYCDYGTNNNDAELFVKMDGVELSHDTAISLTGIDSNPVKFIDTWPSNVSGNTEIQGRTMVTWLDDLEIYLLDNSTDIPPELGSSDTTNPSTKADVDLSGSIDIIDALLTFRNSLGLDMSGTTWKESATGDSNCDGVSNSVDVRLILRDSLDLDMSGTGWCVK